MNRFIRRFGIPALVASLVVGSTLAGAVAFADPPPANGPHHGPHARRGGGEGDEAMLGYALRSLNLNGGQRSQLEQVKAGLGPSREAVKAARKGLLEALAPEVSANNVDPATLKAKIDALATASAGERAAGDAATNRLHSILDTTQRAEVANALEARMTAREQAQHQQQHQSGAVQGQQGQNGQAGHGLGVALARELSLTPAQAQQVASIMQQERASAPRPDFAAMKAQRTAMLEAFKGASFSASSFRTADAGARAKEGAARFVDTAQKITQILTAEQRVTAAQKMQSAAARGRMAI